MRNDGRSQQLKHQGTDVRVPAIVRSVLVFVVIVVFLHVGVWFFYRYVADLDGRRDVRRTFVESPPAVPPEPRLQVDPHEDLQEYLRKQQEVLNSYAWVSRGEGRVRIPVERAMALVVERQKQ
jgi:hypothetical protein